MNKIKLITKTFVVMTALLTIHPNLAIAAKADATLTAENASDILRDRLDRMDGAFDYRLTPEIQKLITLYLGRHRQGSEIMLGRTAVYFPLIEEHIARKNLPQELKYIPIIESSLRPFAKSSMGAAGLWQFMRKTGKMMGLKITTVVDERNDPIKSTDAALDYLSMLYDQFDDWTLAIAAYNCGPGNVRKAIRKAGSRSFWDIVPYLPTETRRYVPKFIATSYVMNYYLDHGLSPILQEIQENPTTAKIYEHVSFRTIANKLGMDMKTIRQMNAAYLKGYIPESEEGHHLTLPEMKMFDFAQELDKIYDIVYQPIVKEVPEEEIVEEVEQIEEIPFSRMIINIEKIDNLSFSFIRPLNTDSGNVNLKEDNNSSNADHRRKYMSVNTLIDSRKYFQKNDYHYAHLFPSLEISQIVE